MSDVVDLDEYRDSRRVRDRRHRSGAFAVQQQRDEVCVVLHGLEIRAAEDACELAGHVILSALESGLTISQLKELAITLRGDAW